MIKDKSDNTELLNLKKIVFLYSRNIGVSVILNHTILIERKEAAKQVSKEDTVDITDHVTPHDTAQDTAQVNELIKKLILCFSGEMSRQELQIVMGIKHTNHFRASYLDPALEAGIIEMTIPEKRNSKNQKYRLTPKGLKAREKLLDSD